MRDDKSQADALFSTAIRSTGRCENSNCRSKQRGVLTTAHIISRRFDQVRCDTRNALCLCFECHRYFEDHPLEFNDFVLQSWAAQYLPALTRKSNITLAQKTDWQERIEFLTDIVCGLKTLKQARADEIEEA